VFNDKHLSWNWDYAKEMVDTAAELGFALLAGSSLPVTQRMPPIELPVGARVREGLCLGVGGPDGYDIHCLEALQGFVERRDGGETGVQWIEALSGDAFWAALSAGSWDAGGWDPALLHACMCRSLTLVPAGGGPDGVNHRMPELGELRGLMEADAKGAAIGPVAFARGGGALQAALTAFLLGVSPCKAR
jgi:hypothetical protein